jgi:uroporphyrinogen III methyltransferase/synthase
MKVLITRPRAQAADFAEQLRQAGFEPIPFPVIEIRPVEKNDALETALANLQKYAWLVFTSINAVEVVFRKLSPSPFGRGARGEGVRVAAVGRKTADALRARGIEPDFAPDEFVGVNIVTGLGDLKDKWVLLPRADIARKELPEAIAQAGGIAHEIIVYHTLPAAVDEGGLAALRAGVDVITFTSPSTVQNFIEVARKNHLDPFHLPNSPTFACIGSVTEKAAREAGFEKIITAKEYTTEGLVSLLAASRIVK